MEKLRFSIVIKAPKEKVWDTMLNDETYRKWTEPFMPGAHFVGSWSEGSKILFLAPGEHGASGMVSRIRENRLHEFISIEHFGIVQDGKEDTSSEAVKAWASAHEDYTFREIDGGTEVLVDTDTTDEYREMFETTWPKALQRLKELAEKREKSITRKNRRLLKIRAPRSRSKVKK
jgi:uncharacterized protein YndB with AHSA1/START domain